MGFTEIASKFWKVGATIGLDNHGGLSLQTMMVFDAICHLSADKLTVENANKKLKELHGFKLNTASLSRNNKILKKLGLMKLEESANDARYKNVILTAKGHDLKNAMGRGGTSNIRTINR